MALNANYTDIANFESVCYVHKAEKPEDERNWHKDDDGGWVKLNGVTHTLVFSTMFLGLSEITKENISEWVWRYRVVSACNTGSGGHLSVKDHEGIWTSRDPNVEELVQHIGLSTNASELSRSQFMRNMQNMAERVFELDAGQGTSDFKDRLWEWTEEQEGDLDDVAKALLKEVRWHVEYNLDRGPEEDVDTIYRWFPDNAEELLTRAFDKLDIPELE